MPSSLAFFTSSLSAESSNDTGLAMDASSKRMLPPSSASSFTTTAQGAAGRLAGAGPRPGLAAAADARPGILAPRSAAGVLIQSSNIQRFWALRATAILGCSITSLPTNTLCRARSTWVWDRVIFLMAAASDLPAAEGLTSPRSISVSAPNASCKSGAFHCNSNSELRLPRKEGSRNCAR